MMHETRPYIDLHLHSHCSDGALSPRQLVARAKQLGLSTIAIADHDSVAGIAEALAAAVDYGVEVIPAVELSVQHKTWQDVHLLGYGMDCDDPALVSRLRGFRDRRATRSGEILERVNERLAMENRARIPIDEVLAHSRDAIGRPHIARALMDRGYANSVEEAFQRYLVPCNVPKLYWPIHDAIREIRQLGGITVLAHPTTVSGDRHELRHIVEELGVMGLDGVEVFNNLAREDEMEFLRRLAHDLGLLVTGGSDFHGIEGGLEMGRGRAGIRFDAGLLLPLKKLLHERRVSCSA